MKTFALLLLLAATAHAQSFRFNDGRTAAVPAATVRGGDVVVTLSIGGEGSAEVVYQANRIVSMEWPAPPELAAAAADLDADMPAAALKKVDAVITAQEPFRLIPGSWWAEAASLRVRALAGAGRAIDAEALLVRLRQVKTSSAPLARAEIAFINVIIAEGRADEARTRIVKLRSEAADDASLAGLAVIEGNLLFKTGETENALLSYLRVPVYHAEETAVLKLALRGAVTCLEKLGDTARATQLRADIK